MTGHDGGAPSLRWRRSPTGRAVLRRIRRAVARRNRPLVGWPAIAAYLGQTPAIVQAWHAQRALPLTWPAEGPETTGPALDAYFFEAFSDPAHAPRP